jgi:hypothetical protein
MDDMKCRIVTLGMMDPASLGRSQTAIKNNKNNKWIRGSLLSLLRGRFGSSNDTKSMNFGLLHAGECGLYC